MPGAPNISHSMHLHTIPGSVPGLTTAPYNGGADIWFENLDDAKALFANDYYITVAGKTKKTFSTDPRRRSCSPMRRGSCESRTTE